MFPKRRKLLVFERHSRWKLRNFSLFVQIVPSCPVPESLRLCACRREEPGVYVPTANRRFSNFVGTCGKENENALTIICGKSKACRHRKL